MLDPTLHRRIAAALGWSEADAKSFSLPTLRDFLRGKHDELAREVHGVLDRGEHLTRGPETPEEALVSFNAQLEHCPIKIADDALPALAPSFKTTYDYESPGPAGPHKGSMVTKEKHKRGDRIRGPFGMAIVRSSRAVPCG